MLYIRRLLFSFKAITSRISITSGTTRDDRMSGSLIIWTQTSDPSFDTYIGMIHIEYLTSISAVLVTKRRCKLARNSVMGYSTDTSEAS